MNYVANNIFGASKRPITKRYTVSLTGEKPSISERFDKKKVDSHKQDSSWYYLGAVGQIGFAIAIPIAGGAFLGSYLDRSWGTYPKLTLGLLILGILVSGLSFYKTVQELLKN